MKRYLILLLPITVLMLYLIYPRGSGYPQAKLTKPDCIMVEYQSEALDFYPGDYYYQEFYKSIKNTWWIPGSAGFIADPVYRYVPWDESLDEMIVKFIYNTPIPYEGGYVENHRRTTVSGYMFSYAQSACMPIEEDYYDSGRGLVYQFNKRFENALNKLKDEFE